jgi:hypothetical protein
MKEVAPTVCNAEGRKVALKDCLQTIGLDNRIKERLAKEHASSLRRFVK